MFGIKKKYLPDNFEELIEAGDAEALKKVFDKCRLDARANHGWYHGETAPCFRNIPAEFVCWLVEQGFNIDTPDKYGSTPLLAQISYGSPLVRVYLDLGASIYPSKHNGFTALHCAAAHSNIDNTKLIIERGADVNAKAKEIWVHKEYQLIDATPLEYALAKCGCGDTEYYDIPVIAETAELLLSHGAQITEEMKENVGYIGKNLEYNRNDDVNSLFAEYGRNESALMKLYKMFYVKPIPKRKLHDGITPITFPLLDYEERKKQETEVFGYDIDTWNFNDVPEYRSQFNDLYDYLVPPIGPAKTVQGEALRITWWIDRNVDNRFMTWDEKHLGIFDTLLGYLKMGNPLDKEDLKDAELFLSDCRAAKQRGDKTPIWELPSHKEDLLEKLSVAWVLKNPEPIALNGD